MLILVNFLMYLINNFVNKHQNVLVHCFAGISRSATLILNYMIRKLLENPSMRNEKVDNILSYVLYHAKGKRRVINPNEGFIKQLKDKILAYKQY